MLALLLVASATGAILRHRVTSDAGRVTVANLVARVNAWWVMVALIALAFAFGKGGVIVLFFLVSFFALREFVSLAYTRRGDHHALVAAFYVALPAQYFLVWIEWYGLYSIFIPVYAFLVLPILSTMGGDTKRFLERTAKVQWGVMVCVFCISHVPALLTLPIPGYEGRHLLLIAWLVIVVQGSDVLQYVWGKLFGRHKVAPVLSPSKTWEGLIGGVASATALGTALAPVTPFTTVQAAAMAFMVCLMGFLGGLVMSAIKRDRGVKDYGELLPGHGGILDRIDSLCFSAPVLFHLTRFFWS